MNKKLKLLIKDGIRKKLNTKWFKIANIILLLIIVLLTNIDSVINFFGGDFSDPTKIYVVDNTNTFYNDLNKSLEESLKIIQTKIEIEEYKKDATKLKSDIKDNESKDIILEINKVDNEYISTITSFNYVDAITVELLTNSLNNIKKAKELESSNIDIDELNKINTPMTINRTYLNEDLDENYELIEYISGLLIPAFIVPFFMLIIIVIQMIGAEINEEKSSKSMEIIISSVSPKVHFISKIITANLYAIIQSILFILYIVIGVFIRGLITKTNLTQSFGGNISGLLTQFVESGMLHKILTCLPWVIIMILLSFVAYSLLAGILASMTTNQEDFQQLQTPIMIIIMIGYLVAILASTYEKSTFIIILSVIPFLSSIIAPVLLLIGQIGLLEIMIAIILLILTIYVLIKYGSRIYKVGILNYSGNNLWKKIFTSLKNKE